LYTLVIAIRTTTAKPILGCSEWESYFDKCASITIFEAGKELGM
jgi:hypothetical protein